MSRRRFSPVRGTRINAAMCPPAEVARIVGELPFFEGLAPEEIRSFSPSFRQLAFLAGETIYREGLPARRLYVVAEGSVKLLRPTAEGRDVLIDFLGRGEFFGSLSGNPHHVYSESAISQTQTCLLAIGFIGFRAIIERHPTVAVRVVEITDRRLTAAHDTIEYLGASSVEQRIAHVLLRLADKLGEPGEEGLVIQLPLSREDLAGMSGTSPESASRTMSRLQEEGIVASGRRWVAVRDRTKLAEIAGR